MQIRSPAIVVQGVIKDFQSGDEITRVLRGIDMKLYLGELVMLVGPSGCGKTTLLSIVTGVLAPTEGKVTINNIDVTDLPDEKKVLFRRKEIGFIFQHYHLFPSLTATENASISLVAADVPRSVANRKAMVILKKIGLQYCLHKMPAHLSGGEQQRVAIARALIHEPEFVVCDEPTSALDEHMGNVVMKILRETVLNSNRTVLVVTHDSRIFHFADRIIYMNDGNIVREEAKA